MINSLPQLILSMMLFLLLFFGIGFLLNMILRSTWIMAVIYPIVVIMIVDNTQWTSYVTDPGSSLASLGTKLISLQLADILILVSGMVGSIIAGIVIRMLRVRGYQMF